MSISQEKLTAAVVQYYTQQVDDRNLKLSRRSGIVNHHFGIGDFHRPDFDLAQDNIEHALARMELNQIETLITFMGEIRPADRILDAGCGRGGTSITLARRFAAKVDGITITPYQYRFAQETAKKMNLLELVQFHEMNYLDLEFPPATFDHLFTSESTQYVYDLLELFGGFSQVLKAGGRYTIATWCLSDTKRIHYANIVNKHYGTTMHRISDYVDNLLACGYENVIKADLTEMALPYFELRDLWNEKSGVETAFINGFKSGEIHYFFITATKPSS